MCFESLLLNDLFYEISFLKYLKNRKIKKERIRKQKERDDAWDRYNIDNHFNQYYEREKRHRALKSDMIR